MLLQLSFGNATAGVICNAAGVPCPAAAVASTQPSSRVCAVALLALSTYLSYSGTLARLCVPHVLDLVNSDSTTGTTASADVRVAATYVWASVPVRGVGKMEGGGGGGVRRHDDGTAQEVEEVVGLASMFDCAAGGDPADRGCTAAAIAISTLIHRKQISAFAACV